MSQGTPELLRAALRRILPLLALAFWHASAFASFLWFADAQGLHRIDTATQTIDRHVEQRGAVALALNRKDGSLWALTPDRLLKYDAGGAALLALDLRTLANNFGAARRLALDPRDDSVWVAGGSRVARIGANGTPLASFEAPAVVDDMALAQDGSLWVLGRNVLSLFTANGMAGSAALAGDMQQSSFIAIDDAGAAAWLGGGKKLFRIALALPLQSRATVETDEVTSALALAPDSGTLWAAGRAQLAGIRRDGTRVGAANLAELGMVNPQVLVFDAASRSLWLGHERGISRFDAAGRHAATFAASVKVEAISAAPAGITPLVTLVAPPNGSLLSNPFTAIRLHYDASCFGQPCNYPPEVFAAYVLTATLNGQPIGPQFVFDPATRDAVYVPAARHPEGLNTFSAFVTDAEGRRSIALETRFTVDTIAPRFVNVTPADGSVFTTAAVTLQGAIDDAAGQVLLESLGGAAIAGPNPAGASFAYQVTLSPGSNALRLTARDPAGNANVLPLTYVFSTLTLTVTSPLDGASIDSDRVTVSGTFSGAPSASITVNGLAAVVSGNAFSAANVPLQFGPNTITVVGTTAQGARATKTLTVHGTAPGIAIASPIQGASIAGDSVLVRGTFQAAANAGVAVNGVTAALRAGSWFAVVPLAPGANTLTAKVTSPSGSSASHSIPVTATGEPPPIEIAAEPTSGLAPLTVRFTVTNPTGGNVSYTFDGAGPFAVPPGGTSALTVTYPEGVFTPTVAVNAGAAGNFTRSFVIEVDSIASIDARLQALWGGVRDALSAGDIERALTYFAPGSRQRYRQVLTDIAPALPAMFASFPPVAPTAIANGDAEYFVALVRNGKKYGYFLYFVRDGEGIWRLQSL